MGEEGMGEESKQPPKGAVLEEAQGFSDFGASSIGGVDISSVQNGH